MSKISIEVGHGGRDVGATTRDGKIYEKNINLTVALELKRQLERHGQEVLMSRESDIDDLARDFFSKAKAWKPDLHISIHTNAFNGTARGFEVFAAQSSAFKPRSTALCQLIEKEVKALGQTSRGIKDSPFLLSTLPCASAYCELGFMDNMDDFVQFNTAARQRAFAVAYAKGIINYLGLPWKKETAQTSVATNAKASSDGDTTPEKTILRVVAGSYSDRKNAENRIKELRSKGIECFLLLGAV